MSIQVKNLTKIYGSQRAVDNISFEITSGEIVGFLGPNGAGKSTTMKILTGFIPPSEGVAVVGGHDVINDPLRVKKIIGYLPEHNPLYLDMFVHEYLEFAGRLYGLRSSDLRSRIATIIDQCGLGREQNKKIETLSKGYRQRVGLAQALIHDPDILILDEPTSGLDPNQLLEIRKLIKDISQQKTVIFSSHIMQEVEALCHRVILINKGTVVADDNLQNLLSRKNRSPIVIVEFERMVNTEDLRMIPGILDVTTTGTTPVYRISTEGASDIRPAIFRFAAEKNLSLIGLRQEENSLESVFQELTN